MIFNILKKHNLNLCLVLLGIAYFYGILSPSHFGMFANDFYLSLMVTTLTSVAVFFGLCAITIKYIGFSTLTWLVLAMLIIIQPVLHQVNYVDALVFPFGLLILAVLLSIVVVNIPIEKRKDIIKYVAWLFLVVGILSVCTQLAQLFYPNSFEFFIAPLSRINRLFGNISQPNTASFVNVLAITSGFYLLYIQYNKKMLIFFAVVFSFLVMGITLTLSRAGILLLIATVIGAMFYPWVSHKARYSLLVVSVLLSVIAYKIGMWLMQSFSAIYQGSSSIERLLSGGVNLRFILLERAWLAFSSNPIFGTGYDSYFLQGIRNIENLAWFETADHAHNIIAQIGAEFGLIGLLAILGVIYVLFKQLVLFFNKKLLPEQFFVCVLLFIFVLYSFSEFPLWYPKFLLPFVFLLGLLDKGFAFNKINFKKPLIIVTCVLSIGSAVYTGLYLHYLVYYEIVVFAKVDNQQKIDAYQSFPNIFGFRKTKEYMLHIVVDEENPDNIKRLIELGDRLMGTMPSMDISRVQARLLMKVNQQTEADMLNRRLCIWEYQQVRHCENAMKKILEIDPNDNMGYAKRLREWYLQNKK